MCIHTIETNVYYVYLRKVRPLFKRSIKFQLGSSDCQMILNKQASIHMFELSIKTITPGLALEVHIEQSLTPDSRDHNNSISRLQNELLLTRPIVFIHYSIVFIMHSSPRSP